MRNGVPAKCGEEGKLLRCSCRLAGWWVGWHGAGTSRLREVAPPLFTSSRSKPAVCLLFCGESACLAQLWSPARLWLRLCRSHACFRSLVSESLVSLHSCDQIPDIFAIIYPVAHRLLPSWSSLTSSICPLPSRPPHHLVARITTPLTIPAHGGSGYEPAKGSQSPTSITSLAPLPGLKRKLEKIDGCSAVCKQSWLHS